MTIDPQQLIWPAAVAFAAGVGVWSLIADRFYRRQPVVPMEPRRPVPWRWREVLLVLLVSVALQLAAVAIGSQFFRSPPTTEVPTLNGHPAPQPTDGMHPLIVLLEGNRRPGVLLLVVLSAVVVAPIAEEFFFRLMLQGWLEDEERRFRTSRLVRAFVPGMLPVLATSLLFGAVHFRPEPPSADPLLLIYLIATGATIAMIVFGLAVALLRNFSHATAADMGFVPEKFWHDVGLGLATFAAIVLPIYSVQFAVGTLLPKNPIVDPISLTLFALVLGTLYYRTHRIVPSIVLHMSLNATSVALAWWLFA